MFNNADTNKITITKNIKGEQQKGNNEFSICCYTRWNKG